MAHFHGRRPSVNKIIADLNPVWGKFGNITVRTVSDTCVLIFIPSVQTREWVLLVGYWQADRCSFSVYPWTADGNLAAQELLFAPTWVVLKNVPPQLYSLDGISVIASGVGEPLHTEKSRLDPYHLGDTKVKVEIDLSKTPPAVVEVRDSQGNSVRIDVEYPSLPPKCINCGKFGHLLNRCNKPKLKIPQKQKEESVISVVKTKDDLVVPIQSTEGGVETPVEVCKDDMKRARSRSRRRSRSRAKAKARALSSPPENKAFTDLELEEKDSSMEAVIKGKEKEGILRTDSAVPDDDSGKGSTSAGVLVDDLEEGEISEDSVDSDDQKEDNIIKTDENMKKDEESLWITKHSKNYRRAIRQFQYWKVNGKVGPPPKSAKLLDRDNYSVEDLVL